VLGVSVFSLLEKLVSIEVADEFEAGLDEYAGLTFCFAYF